MYSFNQGVCCKAKTRWTFVNFFLIPIVQHISCLVIQVSYQFVNGRLFLTQAFLQLLDRYVILIISALSSNAVQSCCAWTNYTDNACNFIHSNHTIRVSSVHLIFVLLSFKVFIHWICICVNDFDKVKSDILIISPVLNGVQRWHAWTTKKFLNRAMTVHNFT